MTDGVRVVVIGATGFLGRAVVEALDRRGADVSPLSAPRFPPVDGDRIREVLPTHRVVLMAVAEQIAGADAVVNCAGNPDASLRDESVLMAPNALLPALVAGAVREAKIPRFIHVSSAVVQGNSPVLDESETVTPFSAYSRSKALGEVLVRELGDGRTVTYRPPSVHAEDRRVSRLTARLARSPLSSVARPGSSPSPQALLENVADAIAFLATCQESPPAVVAHPSEGLTTATVLTFLGGHRPIEVPRSLARALVAAIVTGGRVFPALAANARRIELLWFGQEQAPSWLTSVGWTPPAGHEAWRELGLALADSRVGRG